MKNKYVAYTYLSIKTLLLNRSILLGFVFNLIVALIATLYVIAFQPELPTLQVHNGNFINSLGALNVIVLIVVFFLFSSVAAIMQSVIDDRDSKVSEIISTSISERHYLVGKLVTAFVLIVVTMLSALVALSIAGIVFSIFNPYDFGIFADIIKPLITSFNFNAYLFLLGCVGVCVLMLVTSILFALGISIKATTIVDAFPVSLLVLTPYFLIIGLLIFLPTDNMELWISISASISLIPLFSPIFILMSVLLKGFSLMTYVAIIVSVIYLVIMFKAVRNIYTYAFYVSDKLSLKQLLKLSIKSTS